MELFSVATNPLGVSVAVGSAGQIYRSDSEGLWNAMVSGVVADLYAVAWGKAFETPRWVAVGRDGTILTSPDGHTWTSRTSGTGQHLYGVAFAGVFLAVGGSGTLLLSEDLGATWEAKSSGTAADLFSISVDFGLYTIVGDDVLVVGNLLILQQECYAPEMVGAFGDSETVGVFHHGISETVETAAGYNWLHIDGGTLAETVGGEVQYVYQSEGVGAYDYSEDPLGAYNHLATEVAALLPLLSSIGAFQHFATSSLTVPHSAGQTYRILRQAVESLQLSGVLSAQQAYLVREALNVLSPAAATGTFNHALTQTLSLREQVVVAWLALLTDGIALSASAGRRFEIAARLTERLTAAGVASSRLDAVAVVAQALLLAETVQGGKGASTTEALTLDPDAVARYHAYAAQVDALTLTVTPDMTLRLRLPLAETVALDGDFSAAALLAVLVEEGVTFEIGFGLGGESYSGWVLNTKTFAVSEYSDFPFNSFVKLGGDYYGAAASGLYRLTGDDDAGVPIEARVQLGATDFGTDHLKRLDSVYVGARLDGTLVLKTVTEENVERWYEVTGTTEKLHRQRVHPMARGLQACFWEFELTNVDGADFELAALELVPVVLSRKMRR